MNIHGFRVCIKEQDFIMNPFTMSDIAWWSQVTSILQLHIPVSHSTYSKHSQL